MAQQPDDICGDEPGQYALTDRDTGLTQYIGPNCLALLGFTMQLQAEQDVVDKLLKDAGYVVTKAEKARRVAALAPEFDTGRTIAEVVESAPRPDDDEPSDDDEPAVVLTDPEGGGPVLSAPRHGDDVPTGQLGDMSTPEQAGATDPEAPPF